MIAKTCLVLMLVACAKATNPEDAWNNFMAHYPMAFPSAEEMQQRKLNFFSTHDVIETHNNKPGVTYKLEHNQFSTMTAKEKKSYLGAVPQAHPHHKNHTRSLLVDELITERQATSVDWRTDKCMQPIKKQGSCGSCWAFAATAVTEFNFCVLYGTAIALSEQQLVSCDKKNGACRGGWPPSAWSYVAKAGGQNTQASYPYTSGSGSVAACKFSTTTIGAKILTTAPTTYIKAGDTTTMMKVLSNKGLVLVGICVTSPFYNYKSGVFTDKTCGSKDANHAVVIVGYGTLNGVDYWIIRNSWGTSWGSSGYVIFKRGSNLCKVETYPMYTTVV